MSVSQYLPAIIEAAGAIGGAALQSNASQNAASTQTAAGQKALDFERYVLDRQQANLQPYMNAGNASLARLNTMMGGGSLDTSGTAGASGGMVLVTAPNGEQQMRPAAEADHWRRLGATVGEDRTSQGGSWSGGQAGLRPMTAEQVASYPANIPNTRGGGSAGGGSTGGGTTRSGGSSAGSTLLSILLPFVRGGRGGRSGSTGGDQPTHAEDSLTAPGSGRGRGDPSLPDDDGLGKDSDHLRETQRYQEYLVTRQQGESYAAWYYRVYGDGGGGGGT